MKRIGTKDYGTAICISLILKSIKKGLISKNVSKQNFKEFSSPQELLTIISRATEGKQAVWGNSSESV